MFFSNIVSVVWQVTDAIYTYDTAYTTYGAWSISDSTYATEEHPATVTRVSEPTFYITIKNYSSPNITLNATFGIDGTDGLIDVWDYTPGPPSMTEQVPEWTDTPILPAQPKAGGGYNAPYAYNWNFDFAIDNEKVLAACIANEDNITSSDYVLKTTTCDVTITATDSTLSP